jgi:outer membrane protein TolC
MTSIQQTKTTSILLVALACLLSAPAHAQCGELSWLEAINQALDANQALVSARQTLDAQQKDIAIARSSMLPDLAFGLLGQFSSDQTFSSSAGVIPEKVLKGAGQITETLYNQSYIDTLGTQKHLYKSQQDTFQNTRNQTIAEAGQDYIGVLLAHALMALQQENVALSEGSLELTQAQESSGEVPYSNVLRMQSQLYGAQQQLVGQKSSLLQSRFRFNQVRNRPAEEVCVLEPLTVEKDGFIFSSGVVVEALADDQQASLTRDYLVALGLERSPSIRSLDAEIKAEQRKMKSARRWLIPSLDAAVGTAAFLKTDGQGSAATQDNELFWQVGLTLDWNVLDGGAFIATMNQSKAEFWSLRSQRSNTAISLEENIRGTAAAAMASFERIGLALLQAQAAEENFVLVNEAYLDGATTLLDLIDAQNQLISANTSARQALYQFLSDLLTLEQSIAYYPFLEGDAAARVRELEGKLQGR